MKHEMRKCRCLVERNLGRIYGRFNSLKAFGVDTHECCYGDLVGAGNVSQ